MTAQEIYDVLERTVGAPGMKEDFITYVTEAFRTGHRLEYRFQGSLGFGGKLWVNGKKPPTVTCYPEDETPGRKALIELANSELAILASQD